ncbi:MULTISPECIES: DUF3263 domain-containing protein [unclassified Micromonospora]|uniref:DUF3263 domain-containing protein n=1 Tax=unclassified Micromonospora TaxID=2617518 RepID=UPI002FF25E7F
MPADASPAATDRPEPSGRAVTEERTGPVVPPPRSAPPTEDAPESADPAAAGVPADPAVSDHPAVPADVAGAASGSDGSPAGISGEAVPAQRGPADRSAPDTLTEREERILAFEQQWWKHAGAKEQAIRDTFGLSATRYYQLLNALLDRPAALAAEPVLIGRLRRLRSSRARNRRR